ncbi:related to synaptic vesicle transporter SVOP and related transporters (major facilitator superfamily) [Rhynchosporium secalis]|uniref:Related to synaptic vesicle transporter SVOP and related transporters (Major facilitator superfamily) n=1 Tax=Rhynchosporium secalis TaxID=38038 RepID=A0A1E1MI13_RHYSE|nr:related to synaptic vesicle transporter SVOP and related transporters (major facilitator superfamily) [Rhynchosporium secalis]
MKEQNRRSTFQEKGAAIRRLTSQYATLEGLNQAGTIIYSAARTSIYSAGGVGSRILAPELQFDSENYHDDHSFETRRSKAIPNRHDDHQWYTGSEGIIPQHTQSYFPPEDRKFPVDGQSDRSHGLASEDSNSLFDHSEPIETVATQDKATYLPKEDQPYHVFAKKQKWFVVLTIGAAGLFSGLSSNIYFPSLDAIAKDLNISLASVSFTITSYLIIQGISPVIWGAFSDAVGRRPIYIASFSVYILANIVLSFTPNFAVLVIFRGIQAAGSASTVSIGNGVIQDISPPDERGAFISLYQGIRNFSIAIGPVIGGLLAQTFGFRSIFVFLLATSSAVTIVIVVFLPETMRTIAGNGSLRITGVYQPLIRKIRKEPPYMRDPEGDVARKKVTLMTFIDPLKLLLERDILFNLVFGGVVYTVWSMVTTSTTGLFKERFRLTEAALGLAFLPNGFGTIVGSAIIGKLMTRDYRSAETEYKMLHRLASDYKLSAKNIPADFPIERARLRHLPWITGLFVAATAAYGFSLAFPALSSRPGWIAVPLMFQFIIAATSNAIFALNQTLVSDLCPGKGASATAINNLVRCSLGALGVAFVERMITDVGPAFAFLAIALITVVFTPLAVINWYWGPRWRSERMALKERLQLEEGKGISF